MAYLVKMRISKDESFVRNAYIDFTQIEYIEDDTYNKTIIHMKSGKTIKVHQSFNTVFANWEKALKKSDETKVLEENEPLEEKLNN